MRTFAQEIKKTNFFQELRFVLWNYKVVYLVFGLIIPSIFIVFSGMIPYKYIPINKGMTIWNAYLLVPVLVMCVGHTLGPILLSPPVMLVKF